MEDLAAILFDYRRVDTSTTYHTWESLAFCSLFMPQMPQKYYHVKVPCLTMSYVQKSDQPKNASLESMSRNDGTWTTSMSSNSLQKSLACIVYPIKYFHRWHRSQIPLDLLKRLSKKSQLLPEMQDFHPWEVLLTNMRCNSSLFSTFGGQKRLLGCINHSCTQ